jgi:hypothetical protein
VQQPVTRGDEDKKLELELTYAWDWFQYHAAQRLTAFHFFLIIVSLVAVAYAQSVDKGLEIFGTAAASLGALIAVGFWIIDVRNEELVLCGRAALDGLEEALSVNIRKDDHARKRLPQALGDRWLGKHLYAWITRNAPKQRRQDLITHRSCLRGIESLVGLVFLAGAVWAAAGFPGN